MTTMLLPGFEPEGNEARPTADRPTADRPTAESNEFFTPQWLLDWLPPIALDPCHCEFSNVQAAHGFDIRRGDDGLRADWARWTHKLVESIVWVNPPYSDCAAWMAKCAAESLRCQIPIVALIPAKPGEVYWHESIWGVAASVGFLRGRVPFDTVAGRGKEAGTFGSALVVYGPNAAAVVAHIREASRRNRFSPVWVTPTV